MNEHYSYHMDLPVTTGGLPESKVAVPDGACLPVPSRGHGSLSSRDLAGAPAAALRPSTLRLLGLVRGRTGRLGPGARCPPLFTPAPDHGLRPGAVALLRPAPASMLSRLTRLCTLMGFFCPRDRGPPVRSEVLKSASPNTQTRPSVPGSAAAARSSTTPYRVILREQWSLRMLAPG